MPFGLFGGSSVKFPKRKVAGSYSFHERSVATEPAGGFVFRSGRRSKQTVGGGGAGSSAGTPAGILKKGGQRPRPKSYPSLALPDGMVPQEMAAAIPMPSEPELNAMFAKMVDELGLSRELMFKLPPEKRWELYLSKQKEQQSSHKGLDPQPEYYIDQLSQMTALLRTMTTEQADREKHLKVTSDLKTALRTQPISFVQRFIEQSGLEYLLEFLRSMNSHVRQSQLHYNVVGCVKALMNNPGGRAHVLAHPSGIVVIAQSLRTKNVKIKILTLEILGALCLVPGGHKKVLTAMDHFRKFAMEHSRFQTVIVDLAQSLDDPQDSANLQISVLSFSNVIINYKAGEESLEFRMHLRHEFLTLGILPIISRLRDLNITHLNKHLEIFELVRIEDERELAVRLEALQVDTSSLKAMLDFLQRKTAHTVAYKHLHSIIYHCLLLPIDDPLYGKYWQLIDRLVQQVVLQQRQGLDPDVAPTPINVENIVQQLVREDELRALRLESEELRMTQHEMRVKLRKKEWECESRTMERDQFKSSVEKLRIKLNRKATELNGSWTREQELQERAERLQQQFEEQEHRLAQLENLLKDNNITMGNLPAFSPVQASPRSVPPPPLPPAPPSAPPPPPTPQVPMAPAPPAPPTFSLWDGQNMSSLPRKKPPPKPSQSLKSFNWSKLPEVQIEQTVFASIDDSKVHEVMDLEDFERTFSAYQRREVSSMGTLPRRPVDKPKELSVIDGRRAQNCTILLSKLKMSAGQIRAVVFSMDREDSLNKDMVEQMLKYVPMTAEVELLESQQVDEETFARADRFLLEMSRVPRYAQRLKSLYFRKTLEDRVGELKPRAEDILFSCNELRRSEKLKNIFEVILAFGNFMNRGNRGNAFGFRLSSLSKIVDTKSSIERDVTLLHYLVKTLESKFPDVLTVETDLPHVKNAAKVDLKELQKDLSDLKGELAELQAEIRHHRLHPSCLPNDQFLSSMEEFASSAATTLAELDKLVKKMKTEFERTVVFFGEDASELSTDEFFSVFAGFLTSFADAHVEIIAARKKKEEEERRREDLQRQKELTLRRRRSRQLQEEAASGGTGATPNGGTLKRRSEYADNAEFDELITVLKTGEYFEMYGRKKSRSFRTSVSSSSRLLENNRERLPSTTEEALLSPTY